MRKLIAILLALIMLSSLSIPALAAEDESIDVYAKYIQNIEGEYTAAVVNGGASAVTPNGTVAVSNAPANAATLVVIPMKGDALAWIDGCVDADTVAAFDIHFLDTDGNRINANGVKISITVSGTDLTVSSVTTSGADKALTSEVSGGKVSFNTDGSHYYVIAKKTSGEESETHTITIAPATGGQVTVSTTTPKTGETVTITVQPDDGKIVDQAKVTDESGKAVTITDNVDGTYSFVQLDSDVTVKVTFKNQSSGGTPQTGDNSNIWLWLLLLLISATMLIYIGNKMRKQRAE